MKPFVETRMLGEARKAVRPAHRLIIELLIFLLLMLVASMVESVVIAPCEVGIILSDESFLEAVGSGNLLSLPDVVSDLLSRLPDWFMLVQLFATAGMIATAAFFAPLISISPCRGLPPCITYLFKLFDTSHAAKAECSSASVAGRIRSVRSLPDFSGT